MKKVLFAFLALAAISFVSVKPNQGPNVQPTKRYPVALTGQQWQVVLAALDELPGKYGNPVSGEIYTQLQHQGDTTKPAAQKPAVAPKKKP